VDDRYERICLLGTGAKGDVFLANHRGGGHDVALKFLRSTQPDDLRRFEREATLLAALDHPGLPRFYDYAPDADPPYIAMGRAQGVLAVTLCRQGDANRLRPLEVAEVGLQLAQILVVLHERGIVHRDINANNVIIDLQRRPVVKLVDLGCADLTEGYYSNEAAKRRYRTPPEARVKIPDGGIEKLAWSAPETRAGLGWTDKSDVYSLGLLLFRLLMGKVPIKKAGDPPMSLRELARVCPEELASAIVCALNPDPGERATAAELVLRLQGVLEEDAGLARGRGSSGLGRAGPHTHSSRGGRAGPGSGRFHAVASVGGPSSSMGRRRGGNYGGRRDRHPNARRGGRAVVVVDRRDHGRDRAGPGAVSAADEG
jgi:serine/threonine protein kinase